MWPVLNECLDVVCGLSVCMSVFITTMSCTKMAEVIKMAFQIVDSCGPKERCITHTDAHIK